MCSTLLVFEVEPQYMGKTLRVVCTNCDTPIDAETRQPQQGGPGFQHNVQEPSAMQHANGLANKIAHSFDTDGYGDNNHKHPQAPLHQSSQQQAASAQQQHYHSQKQQHSSGCLKYEVLCPNPAVRLIAFIISDYHLLNLLSLIFISLLVLSNTFAPHLDFKRKFVVQISFYLARHNSPSLLCANISRLLL